MTKKFPSDSNKDTVHSSKNENSRPQTTVHTSCTSILKPITDLMHIREQTTENRLPGVTLVYRTKSDRSCHKNDNLITAEVKKSRLLFNTDNTVRLDVLSFVMKVSAYRYQSMLFLKNRASTGAYQSNCLSMQKAQCQYDETLHYSIQAYSVTVYRFNSNYSVVIVVIVHGHHREINIVKNIFHIDDMTSIHTIAIKYSL